MGEKLATAAVLWPLWVGAGCLGISYLVGGSGWEKVGRYVTIASSFTVFSAPSAMMRASTFGRVILPPGQYTRAPNMPGGEPTYPIQFELGAGVKQDQ